MRPANGGAGQFAVGGLLKESKTAHLEVKIFMSLADHA
jgi:hypothetical protein